jgi:hypothetical protein
MSLRACSTAAAADVPSPGTWLRRVFAAGLGGFALSVFVVM